MTITETTHKQLDEITDEQKAEVRAMLEQGSGLPYNRTVLALIRDAERALVEQLTEERQARQSETNRADTNGKKLARVFEWLQGYARELSVRGRIDNTSPAASVDGAQRALIVREAADKLKRALDLPESEQKSLLFAMGSDGKALTLEEASQAIQLHAPWNGDSVCYSHEGESDAAVVVIGEIEQALAKYYKLAAEKWGDEARRGGMRTVGLD